MSCAVITISLGRCAIGTPATPQNSVAVAPGSTACTRTPLSFSSCCSDWLSASTKALVPPYTPLSVSGEIATMEAMFTSVPPPRSTKPGTAA
ncbi:hypothetical protein D3C87_1109130 [compost metagenome]